MPKAADIGSKRLISLAPNLWIQWVTQIPNLEALEIVSSDFQWVSRFHRRASTRLQPPAWGILRPQRIAVALQADDAPTDESLRRFSRRTLQAAHLSRTD